MRTVRELKEELAKFPDDAVCWAYEGEVTGIIIAKAGAETENGGVIYCSGYDDSGKETELLE